MVFQDFLSFLVKTWLAGLLFLTWLDPNGGGGGGEAKSEKAKKMTAGSQL